jgi:hypothetical protein
MPRQQYSKFKFSYIYLINKKINYIEWQKATTINSTLRSTIRIISTELSTAFVDKINLLIYSQIQTEPDCG